MARALPLRLDSSRRSPPRGSRDSLTRSCSPAGPIAAATAVRTRQLGTSTRRKRCCAKPVCVIYLGYEQAEERNVRLILSSAVAGALAAGAEDMIRVAFEDALRDVVRI
jgi:hypothetical protein